MLKKIISTARALLAKLDHWRFWRSYQKKSLKRAFGYHRGALKALAAGNKIDAVRLSLAARNSLFWNPLLRELAHDLWMVAKFDLHRDVK